MATDTVSYNEYDGYCGCRDCAGDPCTCAWGDHCYLNKVATYCSCCHWTNYSWLGYLGARARWAKKMGVTEAELEDIWMAHDENSACLQ